MSQMQKALHLTEKHGDFVVATVPIERPGPGEILIKVYAAALNPVDWKVQKWNILVDGYPVVLGSSIAGDVEEVGEGVVDFKKGDKVFCQADFKQTRGGFQQHVVGLAAITSKIPPNITYDDASTLPMGLTTAYSGLYSAFPTGLGLDAPISEAARGKYAGIPFFVVGGSSSVGNFAIQLAKLSGFSPIIATASLKHTESLKSLGATHVLDRNLSTDELKAETQKITSQPIKFVYDSISEGGTQETSLAILAPGGRVLLVLMPSVAATEGKEIAKVFAGMRIPQNLELMETLYHDKLYGFLEAGYITPNRVEVLPNGLAGIVDGLERLKADQVSRLKLVARPQE